MSASQGSSTAPPQTSCAASGQWLLSTAGTTNSLPLIMEHNQHCLETVWKGTTARSLAGEARHESQEKQPAQHCNKCQSVSTRQTTGLQEAEKPYPTLLTQASSLHTCRSQLRKWKLREIKHLVQGHSAPNSRGSHFSYRLQPQFLHP